MSDTPAKSRAPSQPQGGDDRLYQRALKEMMEESINRVSSWLEGLSATPKRLLSPDTDQGMKQRATICKEEPETKSGLSDRKMENELTKSGTYFIDDDNDNNNNNANELGTTSAVQYDVEEFRESLNAAGPSPDLSLSSLDKLYRNATSLGDILQILLPINEIQDTPTLVLSTLSRQWDGMPPRAVSPMSDFNPHPLLHIGNSNNDRGPGSIVSSPVHTLGFSPDILGPNIRAQMMLHLQQGNRTEQIPKFIFPFLTVEIEADDTPSSRLRNMYNAAVMLHSLYFLRQAAAADPDGDREEDENDGFYGRPCAITIGLRAEEVELSCHWVVPDGRNDIKCYGRVIGRWLLGKDAAQYAMARRAVRNALEKVAGDNLDMIKMELDSMEEELG